MEFTYFFINVKNSDLDVAFATLRYKAAPYN